MATNILYQRARIRKHPGLGMKTLVSFLVLTFGLSWVPMALFMLFPDQLTSLFGEISTSNPFFLLAVYAPSLSGILLVWRHHGLIGVGSLFRRLLIWRAPTPWWLFLLLGIPVIVYTAAAIKGTINDSLPFSPWPRAAA